VGYVRGELQTAPSIPALPLSARQLWPLRMEYHPASFDGFAVCPTVSTSGRVRWHHVFELADELWPTKPDWDRRWRAMILSNNIQPINMFRINRVSPLLLPSFLKFLARSGWNSSSASSKATISSILLRA